MRTRADLSAAEVAYINTSSVIRAVHKKSSDSTKKNKDEDEMWTEVKMYQCKNS